jgi:hypothetical protein
VLTAEDCWKPLGATWARLIPGWAQVSLPFTFPMAEGHYDYCALSNPLTLAPGYWDIRFQITDASGPLAIAPCDGMTNIYAQPELLREHCSGWRWMPFYVRANRPTHILIQCYGQGGGTFTLNKVQAIQPTTLSYEQWLGLFKDRAYKAHSPA